MVYQSLLASTTNTRDLGGHPAAGGGFTTPNRVWRSDIPTEQNEADAERLKALGITTIIDFRTEAEVARHPCAYAGMDGFTYRHLPIVTGSVPPATLEEVPESYLQIASQPETAEALRIIAGAKSGVLFGWTGGLCWRMNAAWNAFSRCLRSGSEALKAISGRWGCPGSI